MNRIVPGLLVAAAVARIGSSVALEVWRRRVDAAVRAAELRDAGAVSPTEVMARYASWTQASEAALLAVTALLLAAAVGLARDRRTGPTMGAIGSTLLVFGAVALGRLTEVADLWDTTRPMVLLPLALAVGACAYEVAARAGRRPLALVTSGVAFLAVATQALALTDALFRPAGELTHLALFALAGVVGVVALRPAPD